MRCGLLEFHTCRICHAYGHGNKVLEHFKQMCEEGVVPDDVTFVCILSACSLSG
jgi:hypothetical protein